MDIIIDSVTRVQILDEAVSILHNVNTLQEQYDYNCFPSHYE